MSSPPQPHVEQSFSRRQLTRLPHENLHSVKTLSSKRDLTTREKIILLEGSKLHGSKFPPWTSSPQTSDYACPIDQPKFTDDAEIVLSASQLEIFDRWLRPDEFIAKAGFEGNTSSTMTAENKMDLVQDITSDCSVIASLCAVVARSEHGHANIITCNLYPFDNQLQQPLISASGKYTLRLYFNGCFRRVVIDDKLPALHGSRKLHAVDRNNPALLWPALVEKAYLKVRGGYNFPGSNSGTDLWVLTGWIPEHLFLQSDDIHRGRLWQKIYNAFNYGDVLVTMGTGKLTRLEEQGMGLVSEHDYAVIGMDESQGQQLFHVKNPWSEGPIWKGHVAQSTCDDVKAIKPPHGTFWISLNKVFQAFEFIYLNWNPNLFNCQENIHFNWQVDKASSPEGCFASNPQYDLRSSTGGIVWLVLGRHFASPAKAVAGTLGTGSRTGIVEEGFISLYAFDHDGERVVLSDGFVQRSPYVDSPNTLLKLELPAETSYTIVISGQSLLQLTYAFTLSAYSLMPLNLSKAREKYSHTISQQGVWSTSNAGGNASSPWYHVNPQFRMNLLEMSDVALLLETLVEDCAVHVKIGWAGGLQVYLVRNQDIVGDSGEYRKGYASVEIRDVPAGAYTIICSTFERDQQGKFTLRVSSMSACTLDQISADSVGRFRIKARPAVFKCDVDCLRAPLSSQRLNRLTLAARYHEHHSTVRSRSHSALRISVWYEPGPWEQQLAVSGEDEYFDGTAGACIREVDVPSGGRAGEMLWVVIERLTHSSPQAEEHVDLGISSEGPLELGEWRTWSWCRPRSLSDRKSDISWG